MSTSDSRKTRNKIVESNNYSMVDRERKKQMHQPCYVCTRVEWFHCVCRALSLTSPQRGENFYISISTRTCIFILSLERAHVCARIPQTPIFRIHLLNSRLLTHLRVLWTSGKRATEHLKLSTHAIDQQLENLSLGRLPNRLYISFC